MIANYLETGSTDPCFNLAFEEYVLENKRSGEWLILWQNANTVVVGLNQNTAEEIDSAFVLAHGITVVRRRTGGGAVYHDLGNLNYSFITDLGDSASLSISRFTRPVCRALSGMGISAETTGRNDICVDGKKVSGVAQRIYRDRILHHGTLLFDSNPDMVAGALHADSAKFSSKSAKSVRSRVGNIRQLLAEDMTLEQFKAKLLTELTGDGLLRCSLTEEELETVEQIADKRYRRWDWNYGRSPEYDFVNRARFQGGSLEVRLKVKSGVVESLHFYGDFMAQCDNEAACKSLEGVPYRREAMEKALSTLELTQMFGGIRLSEIVDVILGEVRSDE